MKNIKKIFKAQRLIISCVFIKDSVFLAVFSKVFGDSFIASQKRLVSPRFLLCQPGLDNPVGEPIIQKLNQLHAFILASIHSSFNQVFAAIWLSWASERGRESTLSMPGCYSIRDYPSQFPFQPPLTWPHPIWYSQHLRPPSAGHKNYYHCVSSRVYKLTMGITSNYFKFLNCDWDFLETHHPQGRDGCVHH